MISRLLASVAIAASIVHIANAQSHVKCEASVNGFKIHNVYIMGSQYNGVVWAYKHISEETCLTPTLDPSKADAILEIVPLATPGQREISSDSSLSVSCVSSKNSTVCSDSTGNELTVDCSGNVCTSSYGPSPASAIAGAINAWLYSRYYMSEAHLYTSDHKLLWKSETQKGDWAGAGWEDKVRLGTNSPICKCGAFQRSKYKNFRHWAMMTCGVEFDPLVSIDLKLRDRQAAAKQVQDEKETMIQNAHEAAAKQQQPPP